ncbi:MAG: 2-hydroxy-3-oxopropionate reductase [Actinobacteria bacterium]|nr:2-hydroxy-3-oxopropionate reductase [Actinomycetota bacterium]
MTKPTIGFVGLGIMGQPMAANLLQGGYDLVVYNRTPAKCAVLESEGAQVGDDPADVARRSDVVITMLPDSPDVELVYQGESGLLSAARAGQLFIDMSSISPAVARSLAEAAAALGVEALDAPVSGGDVGAKNATLSIMVGGDPATFERARPIFETLGTTIVHMGGAGTGQTAKACNQLLVAQTLEAVSEALVLGSKAGVDPARLIEALSGGLAGNRVMEVRGRNFLEHDFTPGFKIALHQKDLRIAMEAGRELGVSLPGTALVEEMFAALQSSGSGDLDHSAVITVIEDRSDHRLVS